MANVKASRGVTIGDVSGGIHGSIIAGRDVKSATITVGGAITVADKDPTIQEFKQLLADIQQGLAEITSQREALQSISPATPLTVLGVEQNVKDATTEIDSRVRPEAKESVWRKLTEATTSLSGVLDVAKKAGQVVSSAKPIAEKLVTLIEKTGVAAWWATKLWP